MKITYLIMIFAGFMLSHLNAGVVKESKTSVNWQVHHRDNDKNTGHAKTGRQRKGI